MSDSNKLNKQQKEAVGLLSIGTFLEYFDLMLYVHMAVLLNELFFPQSDADTAKLISAFAFCSTYLLRPVGAVVFGYIGDNIGRKSTLIITTLLMSLSCIAIGILPTYAQIGITASWIVTICRMIQGMSSSAESQGAEIYITESIKGSRRYPLVASITVFSALGTSCALGISSLLTNKLITDEIDNAWRIAFFIGAFIGLVGTIARNSLKEASDYVDKKKSVQDKLLSHNVNGSSSKLNEKINSNNPKPLVSLAYFFIYCARPPCFYFIYIYCGDILKHEFSLTPSQIIQQNLYVSIIDLVGLMFLAYISSIVYPIKILKFKLILFFVSLASFPVMMNIYPSTTTVLIYQCLAALFVFDQIPATPIFYKYFPILKRFTHTAVISTIAVMLTYLVTSFGFIFATKSYGYPGIFIIFIPIGLCFWASISYFQKLEEEQNYQIV